MFCSICGNECATAPVNCGPQSAADDAAGIDRWTEEEFSACCEAEVGDNPPLWREVKLIGELIADSSDPPVQRAAEILATAASEIHDHGETVDRLRGALRSLWRAAKAQLAGDAHAGLYESVVRAERVLDPLSYQREVTHV